MNPAPGTGQWVRWVGAALLCCSIPPAAAQVCKWVDENGTVHFAETCPKGQPGEQVPLPETPSDQRAGEAESAFDAARAKNAERAELKDADQPPYQWQERKDRQTIAENEVKCPDSHTKAYAEQMRQRCEAARERYIAPLRQARIEDCVAEGGSREDCENHFEDFMNPQFLVQPTGERAFDNLPECVIARKCGKEAGLERDWWWWDYYQDRRPGQVAPPAGGSGPQPDSGKE